MAFIPKDLFQAFEDLQAGDMAAAFSSQITQLSDTVNQTLEEQRTNLQGMIPQFAPPKPLQDVAAPTVALPDSGLAGFGAPAPQGPAANPYADFNPLQYSPTATPAPAEEAAITGAGGGGSSNVRRHADLIAEASAEYGVPASIIAGIMEIESGGNPSAVSPVGARGLMQVMDFHFTEGENPMDPRTNVMRGAKILADNYRATGNWDKAAAKYFGAFANGEITEASDGGTTGSGYVAKFNQARQGYADMGATDRKSVAMIRDGSFYGNAAAEGELYPNQLETGELSTAEAIAACGIVAAMAFARANGRNPTATEAKEAAAKFGGWRIEQGMGGPQGFVATLKEQWNIAATATAPDPEKIKADLLAGNPVVLSSPGASGHYWVISGYDANTGKFQVGESGEVVGTSHWETWDGIKSNKFGQVDTAIHLDNPASSGVSYANTAADPSPRPGEDPEAQFLRLGDLLGREDKPVLDSFQFEAYEANDKPLFSNPVERAGDLLNQVGALKDEAIRQAGQFRETMTEGPIAERVMHRTREGGLNPGDLVDLQTEGAYGAAKGLYEAGGDEYTRAAEAGGTDVTAPLRAAGLPIPEMDAGEKARSGPGSATYSIVGTGLQAAASGALGMGKSGASKAAAMAVDVTEGLGFLGEGKGAGRVAGALDAVPTPPGEALVDEAVEVMKAEPLPISGGSGEVTRKVQLTHYGPQAINRTEPSMMGRGQMGAEKARVFDSEGNLLPGQVPYTNFYANEPGELGGKVEAHRFGRGELHTAEVEVGPGGLFETTTTSRRPPTPDLQAQGYTGLYFKDRGQAHVWTPLDVQYRGKSIAGPSDELYSGNAEQFLPGFDPASRTAPRPPLPRPTNEVFNDMATRTASEEFGRGGTWMPGRGWQRLDPEEGGYVVGNNDFAEVTDMAPKPNVMGHMVDKAEKVWQNADESMTFGTWYGPDNKLYINTGRHYDDLDDAIIDAQRQGQMAIWDNANKTEIETLDEAASKQVKAMLADGVDPDTALRRAGVTPHQPKGVDTDLDDLDTVVRGDEPRATRADGSRVVPSDPDAPRRGEGPMDYWRRTGNAPDIKGASVDGAAGPTDPNERALWSFFERGMNEKNIAQQLNMGEAEVKKLVKDAKQGGMKRDPAVARLAAAINKEGTKFPYYSPTKDSLEYTDSANEWLRMSELDDMVQRGEVTDWRRGDIDDAIAYTGARTPRYYIPDLVVHLPDGSVRVEEIKSSNFAGYTTNLAKKDRLGVERANQDTPIDSSVFIYPDRGDKAGKPLSYRIIDEYAYERGTQISKVDPERAKYMTIEHAEELDEKLRKLGPRDWSKLSDEELRTRMHQNNFVRDLYAANVRGWNHPKMAAAEGDSMEMIEEARRRGMDVDSLPAVGKLDDPDDFRFDASYQDAVSNMDKNFAQVRRFQSGQRATPPRDYVEEWMAKNPRGLTTEADINAVRLGDPRQPTGPLSIQPQSVADPIEFPHQDLEEYMSALQGAVCAVEAA
jgi:soluble lytic murein transglycosylase-like protein